MILKVVFVFIRMAAYIVALRKLVYAEEIKGIRNRLNMTQAVFALFMGVSKKTVEAWESGQNIPNGPSLRLLWMAEQDPGFPERYGIVKVESMTS